MDSDKIKLFLQKDNEKVEDIIEKYPRQIPTSVVADLLGCHPETVRCTVEQFGKLGIAERKPGKVNAGFVIPTAHFIRWYMCMGGNL